MKRADAYTFVIREPSAKGHRRWLIFKPDGSRFASGASFKEFDALEADLISLTNMLTNQDKSK